MASTPSSPTKFTVHKSFSTLLDSYDGFILDQYGVMHNGTSALPGGIDCVRDLATKHGKKLIILSNTSSLATPTLNRLPKLGYDKSLFSGAVTSGEEASRFVAETYGNNNAEKPKKAVWFTWVKGKVPPPEDFLDQCGPGVRATSCVEEADMVISHGADVVRGHEDDKDEKEIPLGDYIRGGDMTVVDDVLKRCKERDLKMICANPDEVVVLSDGTKGNMPGRISKRYEEMGGNCTYFGKPQKEHFQACLKQLNLPKEKVVHVGDSLHHDIAGANATGIDSVFVVGGIHREQLLAEKDVSGDVEEEVKAFFAMEDCEERLRVLFEKEGEVPTHVVPLLKM